MMNIRRMKIKTLTTTFCQMIYDSLSGPGFLYSSIDAIKNKNIRECLSCVAVGSPSTITMSRVSEVTKEFLHNCGIYLSQQKLDELVDEALLSPESMSRHYHIFQIPKKSGGKRLIEAPDDDLKRVQRALLHNWWYALGGLRHCVQGFVPGRGIKTNADRHFSPEYARKQILMKMDFSDFFTSISVPGLFDKTVGVIDRRRRGKERFRVPPILVRTLKQKPELLSPEYKPTIANMPDDGWFEGEVKSKNRELLRAVAGLEFLLAWGIIALCSLDCRLPQGSPCSPAITNIFMDSFHTTALSCLRHLNITFNDTMTYSIYADDICVTGTVLEAVLKMKGILSAMISRYTDISQNAKKTGIFRCGQSQKVTGVCITDRISISRGTRDEVRAELHNALTGKKTLTDKDKMRLQGMRAHIIGIDPEGWARRCEDLYSKVMK